MDDENPHVHLERISLSLLAPLPSAAMYTIIDARKCSWEHQPDDATGSEMEQKGACWLGIEVRLADASRTARCKVGHAPSPDLTRAPEPNPVKAVQKPYGSVGTRETICRDTEVVVDTSAPPGTWVACLIYIAQHESTDPVLSAGGIDAIAKRAGGPRHQKW